MKVRIDGDEPVEVTLDQPPHVARRHGFSVTEPLVLSHVGEVRGDQADAGRAEITEGRRGEQGRDESLVGPVERSGEYDPPTPHVGGAPQVRFTVREVPVLERAWISATALGDRRDEVGAARQREDERAR